MALRFSHIFWIYAPILPPTLLSITGLVAIINPSQRLALFEFPSPINTKDRELAHGLVRVAAARDLAFGLTSLATWYFGSRQAFGCALLTGALLTATDGFVSRRVIGGNEWKHWMFTPLNLLLGIGLLGWD